MSSKKAINIIVATSTNYGIGYDNKMCWHIPEELKHFSPNLVLNDFKSDIKLFLKFISSFN